MVRHAVMQTTRALATAVLAAGLLAGCGGGADTQQLPNTQIPGGGTQYNGPAPGTADVQTFMVELWTHLRAGGTASCGDCHSQSGGQAPMFARDDDVNMAYAEANPLVDLGSPQDSRLVTKVAGPHNCWLGNDAASAQACADIMTTWIENWAGGAGTGGGRQIQLQAPAIISPGDTKNFPPPVPAEFSVVYDLLDEYCSGCHANSAPVPQSPFFADADINIAYDAVKPKLDLNNPADSRLVLRLRDDFHNCWDDCAANAAEMQAAIESFANSVPLSSLDPSLVNSAALRLIDGVVASGGNRYEANQIALWEFKYNPFDTSGVSPAMDLTLSGDVEYVGGWGINIQSGKAQALTSTSRKLHDLITATGEYAIEAWVAPANVVQEDTRIISYSAGVDQRNFMLGQTLYSYDAYNRSSESDANGDPALSTSDADEDLQATLQHVVVNYDPVNGRQIFVNGVFTDDVDPVPGGTLGDWDDSFAFVLGNEVSGDRQWQGVIRMVAIHNRTLTPEQINQNLAVGVGEKFFLLFYIGDIAGVDVNQAYILFEVSQFDSYSYLFNTPIFISLDDTVTTANVPLVGMRIGVNGREAVVGQAYANLDLTLTDPVGQPLTDIGTIIPLENGPDSDQFFLTFEQLGTEFGPVTPAAVLTPPPVVLAGTQPDIGLRTFDEINASMSAVTTVPATDVEATYDLIRQQLPAVADADTFSSAQEIGVAQLAIAYCDALVEDDLRRTAYFPGFGFAIDPGTAFINRDLVINPLIDHMLGDQQIPSQPDFGAVYNEIDLLIDELILGTPPPGGPAPDSPQRTRDITKAACAAVLASAVVLIQ